MERPPQDQNRLLDLGGSDDREIPLAELWAMVATRWRLVVLVAALGTVLSATVAFLRQPVYLYSSPVLIGAESGRLLDNPETARVKLAETYIPSARDAYGRAHPDLQGEVPVMIPRTPPGSSVVLLESEGTEAESAMHAELHGAAIAALARDHLETLEQRREVLARRLRAAEHAGVQMQGQFETLAAETGRLSAEEKVLAGQLLALRDWLAAADRQSTDEALAGLRETRAMSPTRRSDVALGPSPMVVVGGGAIGSLLAGILVALGAGIIRPGAVRP
jgi:hypothetical protein